MNNSLTNKQSNVKRDSSVEKEIAKFLDRSLYKSILFSEIERVYDKKRQRIGIDIIISSPALDLKNVFVDEKSQSSYENINSSTKTFVLELSHMDKQTGKKEITGWFLKNHNTDFYLFVWLDKANKKDYLTEDDIKEVSYCIVSRGNLLTYFENESLSKDELKKINDVIRKENKNTTEKIRIGEDKYGGHFYFTYSGQLFEKSINIVIKKSILYGLSILRGKIIRDDKKKVFHVYKYFTHDL